MNSRQSIAQRAITRAKDRGAAIDGDAQFVSLVDLWIARDIEMPELRSRYRQLLEDRLAAKRIGAQKDRCP